MSAEFTRRDFLKTAMAATIGAAAGMVNLPVEKQVDAITKSVTSHPVGNASIEEQATESCKHDPNPTRCINNYQLPLYEKVFAIVVSPLIEEGMWRIVPSYCMDLMSGKKVEGASHAVLHGEKRDFLSRKELTVGLGSSILFAASHNETRKGFDTKTIPAAQFVSGLLFWGLHRRLGLAANITAHSVFNAIAVND